MLNAASSVALGSLSVGAVWMASMTLAGHVIHPSLGFFQASFPALWHRLLLLALPMALLSLGISTAIALDPRWGGSTVIVAGIAVPAAISLWLGGGRMTSEIAFVLAAIAVLGVWLGNAIGRSA